MKDPVAKGDDWRALAATLVLCALMLWPGDPPGSTPPPWPEGFDKVGHAGFFFVGSLVWHRALWRPRTPGRRVLHPLLATGVVALFFAVITELLQRGVPHRSSDLLDGLADMAGYALFAGWRIAWPDRREQEADADRGEPQTR